MIIETVESTITWIVTVWIPSLLLIAVVRYFAKKHQDKHLNILGYCLEILVSLMLILKIIANLPDLEKATSSPTLNECLPVIIGVILGTYSIKLTRSFAIRLQKLSDT